MRWQKEHRRCWHTKQAVSELSNNSRPVMLFATPTLGAHPAGNREQSLRPLPRQRFLGHLEMHPRALPAVTSSHWCLEKPEPSGKASAANTMFAKFSSAKRVVLPSGKKMKQRKSCASGKRKKSAMSSPVLKTSSSSPDVLQLWRTPPRAGQWFPPATGSPSSKGSHSGYTVQWEVFTFFLFPASQMPPPRVLLSARAFMQPSPQI